MRILFFIGTLGLGGAERQIAQLALGLAKKGHYVSIATLFSGGNNWEWLEKKGMARENLVALSNEKPSNILLTFAKLILAIFRLRLLTRKESIDILFSNLYLSNLISWFACLGRKNIRLVWGIRASNMTLNWNRLIPFRICRWFSFSVSLLISNSQAGLAYHESQGYKAKKHVVIYNGIDTDCFKPEQIKRERIRAQWGIMPNEKVIGTVGRFDPVKGFDTFIKCAALLGKEKKNVRFVCVGEGPVDYTQELRALAHRLGLDGRMIWAGVRDDMPAVYNAFDIASCSSRSEGFSNAIGEAMACGVPCVVTDVGDSAWIVGDTGVVVPPQNPMALAQGLKIALEKDLNSSSPRQRIIAQFSLERLLLRTEETLDYMVENIE